MKISSNFDSGNIEVADATDPSDIQLRIRKDTNSDYFQWFHFQATGPAGAERAFTIVNAGDAACVYIVINSTASLYRLRPLKTVTVVTEGIIFG